MHLLLEMFSRREKAEQRPVPLHQHRHCHPTHHAATSPRVTSTEVTRSPGHSPIPAAPAPAEASAGDTRELPVPSGDRLCLSRDRRGVRNIWLAPPKGCFVNTNKVCEDQERKASDAALSDKSQIPH